MSHYNHPTSSKSEGSEVGGHSPHVQLGTGDGRLINHINYQPPQKLTNFNQGFSISSQNCRSLLKNADNINELLGRLEPSVLALQEIWHSNTSFEGYTLYSKERVSKRGGGVAILVKSDLYSQELFSHIDYNLEIIAVKMENRIVVSIYLPPKSVLQSATDMVRKLLSKYKKQVIYLAGDLNVDLMHSNQCTDTVLNLLEDLTLCPTTAFPTRITSHSATLIDGIFTNSVESHTSGIFTTDVSDHLMPFLICNSKQNSPKPEVLKYRRVGEQEIVLLKLFFKNEDWSQLDEVEEGHKFEKFSEIFKANFDLLCPEREKVRNRKLFPEKEFMTHGLHKSRNTKDDLHCRFVRTRKQDDLMK